MQPHFSMQPPQPGFDCFGQSWDNPTVSLVHIGEESGTKNNSRPPSVSFAFAEGEIYWKAMRRMGRVGWMLPSPGMTKRGLFGWCSSMRETPARWMNDSDTKGCNAITSSFMRKTKTVLNECQVPCSPCNTVAFFPLNSNTLAMSSFLWSVRKRKLTLLWE